MPHGPNPNNLFESSRKKKKEIKLKYYKNHYIFGQSNIFCTFKKHGKVMELKKYFRQCDRDCHPIFNGPDFDMFDYCQA